MPFKYEDQPASPTSRFKYEEAPPPAAPPPDLKAAPSRSPVADYLSEKFGAAADFLSDKPKGIGTTPGEMFSNAMLRPAQRYLRDIGSRGIVGATVESKANEPLIRRDAADTALNLLPAVPKGIDMAVGAGKAALRPVASGIEAAGEGLKGMARTRMQGALKPTIAALRTGKADKAIDTMLEQGINVSPGGVEKMQSRIHDLNTQIADQIANSPAIVDKQLVADRLQGVLKDFENQVTPTSDIVAIQKAYEDFMNHPLLKGNTIPVQKAQELKQGTYKSLGDKSYGELKGADIEAQKALARGLKEEIAKAVPEVVPLNKEESALLNALSVSERRVMMEANKNPFGLAWLTTNPVKFAGFMADRSGLFQSLVARMLNKSGEAVKGAGAGLNAAAAPGQAAPTMIFPPIGLPLQQGQQQQMPTPP